MVIKTIQFLLIFCCFFSLIHSETEVIKFKGDGIDEEKKNTNSYQIDFSDVDLKNYIHFKVTSKSEHNQIVIISEDQDCNENRKALGIQTYYPIHLFISKKEVNSKKSLYLCIQCQKEDSCVYNINIKMEDKCQLEFGEQTSYYVNSLNEIMNFTFKGNIQNNLRNLEEDNISGNIWIKGQDIESTKLISDNDNINGNSFGFGDIYLIDNINYLSSYNLTVQSKEGDYITVGSLKIKDENMNSKILRINDLEIMGIINKESKICFQIDTYTEQIIAEITGKIYTKKAGISFNNSENIKEIKHGVIFEHISINKEYNQIICITYPENEPKVSNVIFSLQLASSEINNYNQFYYAIQLPGVIYPHYLPKNGIAVFRSMKPKNGANEISYNMKAIKGYPDMLFDRAEDFPYSKYNEERIVNCKNPHHANRMTSYNIYLNDTDYSNCNPLSSIQPILIVHCVNGTNEEEMKSSFCEFETSIYTNEDKINLLEEDTYSQYLLKDEKDQYTINIEYEDKLEKVYLDLIVFSGDVKMEIDSEDIKPNANKYYLSNKIFYSIHANENNRKIDFHVEAQKNSFYLVTYKLVRENDESGNINKIETGINFIESIYIGKEADYLKYFDMENLKYKGLSPFLASFYSQNCEFAISRKIYDNEGNEKEEEYIPMYDYYGQIMIDENEPNFNYNEYRFKIEVMKDDISDYKNKVCMIYATGLEYSNSDEGSEKTISVSEGVPQYYKFSPKYPYMKYTYFVSDRNNQLVISFHLIDEGIFKVKILHNYIIIKEQEIYRDDQMFLNKTELIQNCLSENEVCPIDIFIKLNNTDFERRLETTIYQVRGAPIYLEKNAVKQDILLGSVQKHFYFDIGGNESGDITIDHIRGSGYIYAKIENKTQGDGIEGYYYDWRGMYNFPYSKNESLRYETYFKKIDITKENTKYCDKGCYVLITIESSLYDESELTEDDPKLVPYRITITPRIYPNRYEESISSVPKVKMSINQFIIGNVYKTENKIFTYYQVNLPYDSEYILFDWQADIPRILINVGKDRPTINGSDFAFETAGDTVLKLDKNKILECAKARYIETNSTENVNLTIGIMTHKLDTLYTSVFAFKIFMSKIYQNTSQKIDESIINIIYIRSDQKVQCLPIKNKDGIFTCVFAVIFDEGDVGKNLVVYPRAQRENIEVEYSGLIVESEKVEKNDFEYISEQLNNEKQIFPTEKGKKYIYYDNIDRKKCILFKVTLKTHTIIEVLSSIYIYSDNQIFIPNPSTPLVFAIGEKKIAFNFETTQDLLINIVCISGEGEFYWEVKEEENIKYYLYDFGDRISLTSGTYNKSESLSNLIIKSTSFVMFETDEAGFVFYITFYPRNENYNIDQLKIGRSTEFEYRDVKFPLNYYTKLTSNEISVGFSFYNYFLSEDTKLLYDKTDFKIWGLIITEKEALEARITEVLRPKEKNAIYGSFDGAFASLFLNENEINSFDVKDEDNPYLFFSIEPKKEIKNINGISLEVSLLNANQLDYFAPEYVYLNGKFKVDDSNSRFVYKLRTDPKNQYMRVEFSANSKLIKWDVSKDENLNNTIQEEKRFINGRYIMTFQVEDTSKPLYLIIYSENTKIDPKLGNYVFKYMNAKSKDIFFEFEQEKTQLKYSIKIENGKKIYNVSFYPVEQYDVNYYVKAIYKNSEILGEEQYTIAITESNGYYLQIDNPKFESYEMNHLIIEIPDNKTEISYFKIMAKVNFDYLKEYLVYEPLEVYEGELPPDYNDYIDVSPGLDETIKGNYYTDKKQVKFKVNNPNRNQKYKICFNEYYEIPDYIRVRVIASNTTKNKLKKQVVSFYPNDEAKTRLQINQLGVDNMVDMWIKKEQLEDKYLFVTVECKVDDDSLRCDENYYIEFEGSRYATIPSITFNYNYYVSKNNTKMIFAITNDLNISEFSDKYITFYAIGEKDITLSLGNYMSNDEQYNFRDGVAITTQMEAHDFFLLNVEAKEGYSISIGSKVTHSNGQSYQNKLKPNDHVYTGYLRKNYLQKECYTIPSYEDENFDKISYIVGIFYEKIAEISFKYENFTDIKELTQINTKGYISYVQYNEIYEFNRRKYICIGFPQGNDYEVENIAYTLQITQPTKQIGLYNFYSPQLRGNIYPRIVPKGGIVFFNAANLDTDAEEIIYNMITLEGLPKMFINKCTNYPLCDFDLSDKKEVKAINEINRMSSWHNKDYLKDTSPIDKEQYIMIVNCVDLENSKSNICRFETAIYGNNDEINLIEEESFSQYLLKGKNTTYIIDYSIEKKVTKVQVDNFIVNGDAKIDLYNENNEKINSHEYYLANKNFFSINLSQNLGLKKIIVNISASADTYYTIEYKLVRGTQEELVNDIYTGINYLVPILPSVNANKKRVNINSIKLLANDLFFASFYSFNCRFKIERVDKDKEPEYITSYVDYAQDIIDPENEDEQRYVHSYDISVVEPDISKYKNNMCILYVSGLDITKEEEKEKDIAQKEILIGEGIPQRTVFKEKLRKIKYIYPDPDKESHVVIFFKVINPADYKYTIKYNNKEEETKSFYESHIDYLDKLMATDHCGENELCNIIITIFVQEIQELEPILEVTVKQINNIPYYIPKAVVKEDFVPGNSSLYLYTTLGEDDEGYVTVDFFRGSGLIYAKIVGFDDPGDKYSDWRKYSFPKEQNDSLYYEFYNKRIKISNEKTHKCKNGCYLLINLRSSVSGSFNEQFRFHLFTITVSLTQSGELKKVGIKNKIDPEDYAIGSLSNLEKIKSKDMYEFYQITIPYDADKVEFDWQSDASFLLVNVGENRPIYGNNSFNSSSVYGSDSLISITNQQIKNFLLVNNYITNVILTIGIYTEDLESILGTQYSFRVHFSKDINIYKVNSDQKVICKPDKLNDNEYRCLFMVTYAELDFIYDLMIYSRSQSSLALTYMYADFIKKDIYDSRKTDKLKEIIPNEKSRFNSKKSQIDFIFLTLADVDCHLYVSVISDKPDDIEFITSFKTFDDEMSPNPSSIQLFAMNNQNKMKLNFKTTKGLFINIASLVGYSNIYLHDEKNVNYTLRGRDNKLSLAIPSSDNKETILIIENMNKDDSNKEMYLKEEDNKIPKLAFLMEYFLRGNEINFDEVYVGQTTEIAYKKADLPLYYYSKIKDLDYNINAFFALYDLIPNNININSEDIILKGSVITQRTVYHVKLSEEIKPNVDTYPITGVYDPALKVGQITFSKENLQAFHIEKNPYIYLSFEKGNQHFNLNKIRLELTILRENEDSFISEKSYQFGKLKDRNIVNKYKLKVDNSTGDIRIQFSTNSKYIDFSINNGEDEKKNITYDNLEKKVEKGKVFVTFQKPENRGHIYLNVFLKDKYTSSDIIINNYAFKYMNSINRSNFLEYEILDNDGTLQKKENSETIQIKCNKINTNRNVKITYSLKAVESKNMKVELFNNIALTESIANITQVTNSENNNLNEIIFEIKKDGVEYSYYQVIAQIIDGPIIEYVAYDPIGNFSFYDEVKPEKENENDENNSKNVKILITVIVIAAILLIGVIALVIIILTYNVRNKNLMEQVNKISFVKSGAKPIEDTNLLLDNQNELE